jgi:hypothetical protein
MILVNGARLQQLLEHNGQPPSLGDRRKGEANLEELNTKHANSGLCLQLVGEEIVSGRPVYVVQATPHPGYQAHSKYGKMLSKVDGKLWVEKQDFGWIKMDGQVTQLFSTGLFVTRVQRGSHVILEQSCVGDGVWVLKRIEMRASARILFLKSLDVDRILTYSDYRPATDGPYSVSR